jgi:hypothetical protein
MKTCKCGKQIASNARTCPFCGHRFTHPFTMLIAVMFVGVIVLAFIGAMISNTSTTTSTTAQVTKADTEKQVEKNGQDYAPIYHSHEDTPEEVALARMNLAAIEVCKAETVKRQPNAKDYVAKGSWFKVSQKDVFHVSVDWGLGGTDALMVSDCRIANKNGNMTLTKIKFTFAN